MIKPNLIASHDWHVQPICQRSLRAIRLSETPGIEVRTLGPAVLELDAQRGFSLFQQQTTAFWREPSKVIRKVVTGQVETRPNQLGQPIPLGSPFLEGPFALRKKSKSGQRNAPEPLRLAGDHPPGRAMACSL
jgi:hypothetical protein